VILCDAGVLLCLIDKDQPKYKAYVRTVAANREPMLTTWACVTEAMYLALGSGGWQVQKNLARILMTDSLTVQDISCADYARLFALMEKYQDRPMDLADATLVLAAEKTRIKTILTLDSDFLFYRINDRDSFEIVEV